MLRNPSIETTKEMKRMLFLLKIFVFFTSSRVLLSPLFSFVSFRKSDSIRAFVSKLASSLVSHLCLFRFLVVLRRV